MQKSILVFAFSLFCLYSFAQDVKAVDHTLNAGKVEWLVRQVQLEKIPHGKPHIAEFPFKNISSEPLFINWVRTSCHCTATKWPSEPIEPGETGLITVEYDALSMGKFYKIVSVLTNFDPKNGVPLVITGEVIKSDEGQ